MKNCPYCDYANYDNATVCRKCEGSFVARPGTVYQEPARRIEPARGKGIRSQALSLVVLGLLIKVYWGGYGPWPTIDFPVLVTFRTFAEPLLLYGGAALYILGWVVNFI
jgi:hypothetical protein